MSEMRTAFFLCLIILSSCSGGGINYGKSGDDNSHLRSPQYPKLPKADSIVSSDGVLYLLDREVMLNRMLLCDSFFLERCYDQIGKPDSIHRGGPKIIEEFGVDDFQIFMGASQIVAGLGQILNVEIRDKNLKLLDIGIGTTRAQFERTLGFDLPNKETVEYLVLPCDGVCVFQFKKETILKIDYFAAPI